MEKSHHELYYAAAIANIEGCKKLLLPLTDANETTRLPFLENRVRTALTVSLEVQKDYPEGFVFFNLSRIRLHEAIVNAEQLSKTLP